ncbi:hypothetical protein AC578_10549, partial [Pseudocercospora eumusae]
VLSVIQRRLKFWTRGASSSRFNEEKNREAPTTTLLLPPPPTSKYRFMAGENMVHLLQRQG